MGINATYAKQEESKQHHCFDEFTSGMNKIEISMAERVRFELTVPSQVRRFSIPLP